MQFSPIEGLIIVSAYVIPLVIWAVMFAAAVFFVRWAMGINRFLAIAEESLELNRHRAAHAEKSAAMLVAIRDRLEQQTRNN